MKKQLLIIGIIFFKFYSVFGQEIHSPAEIFKIMENSPVTYELNELKKKIPLPDRSTNLNYNHCYRVINDNQIFTYNYKINNTTQEYINRAEKYFNKREFTKAREMYLKAYNSDSSFYQVMTYIGQMYGIEGNYDKAIEWYTKTINLNYIDYMAHWFLADIYKMQEKLDKAVDEITIAMILNRNNPRIKQSLMKIYELKKLNTDDWEFNPQMQLDSIGKNNINITFDIDWLGYAMVKAVWAYEPGYKKSMGVDNESLSTLEEKECLASLITSLDKKKLKIYPEFKALNLSLERNMIDEYIFYEIILPEHPFVAYQLPEEFINSIKNYVKMIRGTKK